MQKIYIYVIYIIIKDEQEWDRGQKKKLINLDASFHVISRRLVEIFLGFNKKKKILI